MFKIKVIENSTDHSGKLHKGFVNVDGIDATFFTVRAALEFALHNADFLAEFNHWKIEPVN